MAIFTAIAAAIFGAGTFLAGAGAIVLQVAAGIGINLLAQKLAGKNASPTDALVDEKFSINGTLQAGGVVPRSFNLGYSVTAGSLAYANTWGNEDETPNAYFTQVIALADLPVDDLAEVWVSGVLCTLDGTPHADFGNPVLEYRVDGKDHLWVKFYDGTQTAADGFLVSRVSSAARPYESTRVGVGCSYVVCTALVNDKLFTGFPTYKFAVQGCKLYDITKDTTAGGSGSHRWSTPSTWGGDGDDLPAVQIYNILRGMTYSGEWFYGLQGMAAARLPSTNWIAQIENCRDPIDGPAGPEPSYRSGGQIIVGNQIADTVEQLLTACQGKLSEIGGFYKLNCGAPGSSVFSFTDEHIISTDEQSFTPFFGLAQTINGITASFPSPVESWNMKAAPPLLRPDFETLDGNRRLMADVALNLVPYEAQVQRLMKSALEEARRARRHTHVLPPEAWVVEPGDICDWTSDRNGYAAKLFRADGVLDKANLDVMLDITEVDPADYDWDQGTDYVTPTDAPMPMVRPPAQAIIDWFAEPTAIYDDTGLARRPAILLSWDGDMEDIAGIEYEVRLESSHDVVVRGRTENFAAGSIVISHGILPQTDYQARGRYIPASPRDTLWSDWLDVTTPDVRLSIYEFEAGLRDYVTRQLRATTDRIDQISQWIASYATEQDAANWTDKKEVRTDLVAREGALSASISEVALVAVGAEAAVANLTVTVTATFEEQSASIQTVSTAVATLGGQLGAQWTVTLNVNGYVSGLHQVNSGAFAAFTILADVFRVAFPGVAGGDPTTVFELGNVNGVARIVYRGDMFADGSITARTINVANLSAISASFGTAVYSGQIYSQSGKMIFDATNNQILIFD